MTYADELALARSLAEWLADGDETIRSGESTCTLHRDVTPWGDPRVTARVQTGRDTVEYSVHLVVRRKEQAET